MGCTFDRSLQKRAGHCLFNCFECFVVSFCMSDTDMCDTLVCHNRLYIGKIQINQCRKVDQVGNTLYCLLQNLVCFLECFRHRGTAVYNFKQLVIWNYDQCIYIFLEVFNTCKCVIHAGSCFKTERFCHNADSQDAHLFCNTCNYRGSTCSGTAAHTTGNEYHVCTLHSLSELFGAFFGCLTANLRLCTCTKSFCYFFTDLNCVRCFAKLQCLLIGIDTNKFYTCDRFINHSIHSVIACTAHTDYDDLSRRLSFVCHNF